MINQIKKITNLNNLSNVFLYGSRAFNVATNSSDYDFIVLSKTAINGRQFNQHNFNITTYTPEHFQEKLNENKPFAIECFFLPDDFKLINEIKFSLILKDFEKEYLKKIKEDEEKLDKFKGNYTKILKTKFFILKLKKQLEWLTTNTSFSFDLKEDFENIKKENLWL